MKMRAEIKPNGFTLVEVIITLVVVAVIGAMLFSVLGSSMTRSSDPLVRMKTSFELQKVVENFVTSYGKNYAGDLPALRDAIAGGVTTPPGNEGGTVTNNYGKYTIVENHFIKFESNQEVLAGIGDAQSLLKVTIKNSNNETLTYIFPG